MVIGVRVALYVKLPESLSQMSAEPRSLPVSISHHLILSLQEVEKTHAYI